MSGGSIPESGCSGMQSVVGIHPRGSIDVKSDRLMFNSPIVLEGKSKVLNDLIECPKSFRT